MFRSFPWLTALAVAFMAPTAWAQNAPVDPDQGAEAPRPTQDESPPGQPAVLDLTASGVTTGPEEEERSDAETQNAIAPEPAHEPGTAATTSAPVVEESTDDAADSARPNLINLSVLGFIGRFRLTYERMLAPRHGVFAEALLSPNFIQGFDYISYGGSLGYRFHWRGPARGPFVGSVIALEHGSGTQDVLEFGDDETYTYEGSSTTLTLAPHAGYRWQFDSGFNITLRGGLGVAHSWLDPDPDAESKAIDILDSWTLGIDGEASLGWAF